MAELVIPDRIVPTQMEIVDIAGLVKGASKGEGLGNKFLGNIREVDAIIHVVRCFEDENIIHVEGRVNPISDKEIIDMELQLKDLETIEKRIQALSRVVKSGDKEAVKQMSLAERIKPYLEQGKNVRGMDFDELEWDLVKEFQFWLVVQSGSQRCMKML